MLHPRRQLELEKGRGEPQGTDKHTGNPAFARVPLQRGEYSQQIDPTVKMACRIIWTRKPRNTHRLHSVSHTCNWAINVPTVWFSIKKPIWMRGYWHGGQGWGRLAGSHHWTKHCEIMTFSLSRCRCQISWLYKSNSLHDKGDFAHPTKSRLQPYPGLPPRPSLINSVFKSKEDKMALWMEGWIQNDCLWSWGKEASEQEFRKPLEATRGKETNFPIQAPERNIGLPVPWFASSKTYFRP